MEIRRRREKDKTKGEREAIIIGEGKGGVAKLAQSRATEKMSGLQGMIEKGERRWF